MKKNAFGRILSTNSLECVVSYSVSEESMPRLGAMVRIPLSDENDIYGLVTDIQIEDDGFLRQIASASSVSDEVMMDTRLNRNVPIVVRVLFIGCREDGKIQYRLPSRPPLSLEAIYICDEPEVAEFTSAGRFGYLRHVLRAKDVPIDEILAAHIRMTARAQTAQGNKKWSDQAIKEIIMLLKDDYDTLITVLGALGDADISNL